MLKVASGIFVKEAISPQYAAELGLNALNRQNNRLIGQVGYRGYTMRQVKRVVDLAAKIRDRQFKYYPEPGSVGQVPDEVKERAFDALLDGADFYNKYTNKAFPGARTMPRIFNPMTRGVQ